MNKGPILYVTDVHHMDVKRSVELSPPGRSGHSCAVSRCQSLVNEQQNNHSALTNSAPGSDWLRWPAGSCEGHCALWRADGVEEAQGGNTGTHTLSLVHGWHALFTRTMTPASTGDPHQPLTQNNRESHTHTHTSRVPPPPPEVLAAWQLKKKDHQMDGVSWLGPAVAGGTTLSERAPLRSPHKQDPQPKTCWFKAVPAGNHGDMTWKSVEMKCS